VAVALSRVYVPTVKANTVTVDRLDDADRGGYVPVGLNRQHAYRFESGAEVQGLSDEWLWIYSERWPHEALGSVPSVSRRVIDGVQVGCESVAPKKGRELLFAPCKARPGTGRGG
jgi:hypothetical protein